MVSRPAEGACAGSQPGICSSGVAQLASVPTSASSFTCHTVCSRVVLSTPIAFSISSGRIEVRDLALPDVEIDQVLCRRSAMQADWASTVVPRSRPAVRSGRDRVPTSLLEPRLPRKVAGAVVLGEQAIDVDAAAADLEVAGDHADLEAVGRLHRHHGGADRIQRAGLDAPTQLQRQCVPLARR